MASCIVVCLDAGHACSSGSPQKNIALGSHKVFRMLHPEWFWEKTNAALKCSECTDKLCIQYCQKLKKK